MSTRESYIRWDCPPIPQLTISLYRMILRDEPFANDMCSHWDWLLKEITGGEVVDEHGTLFKSSGYGLENAYKNLDKEDALLNADSYVFPFFLPGHLY